MAWPALFRPQPVESAPRRSSQKLEYRLVPIGIPPPVPTQGRGSPARVETSDETASRLTRIFNKVAADGWEQVAIIPSGQNHGTFILFKRPAR